MKKSTAVLKRTFDIICSFLGLIVLSPIFLILSLMIVFDSRGGVFFRGVRVGKNGKPFKIFKFRSMRKDCEGKGAWNVSDADSRVTRVGHFLRKSKLDELPQLINVFIGEMSLVGPRPELQYYVNMYTEREMPILDLKPGITDWASLSHFEQYIAFTKAQNADEFYLNEIRPIKLRLQLYYHDHCNIGEDIRILLHTVLKFFLRKSDLPKDIMQVISGINTKYNDVVSESV